MQKDQSYHESAIKYNEGLAEAAEILAPTIEHPEVQRWCTAVGKQHRFHAKRHHAALEKIILRGSSTAEVEGFVDGLDVPEPDEDDGIDVEQLEAIEETEAILADEDAMDAIEEAEAEIVTTSAVATFSDGCVQFHQPVLLTCEFNPSKVVPNA
jgi:hypothetical protein